MEAVTQAHVPFSQHWLFFSYGSEWISDQRPAGFTQLESWVHAPKYGSMLPDTCWSNYCTTTIVIKSIVTDLSASDKIQALPCCERVNSLTAITLRCMLDVQGPVNSYPDKLLGALPWPQIVCICICMSGCDWGSKGSGQLQGYMPLRDKAA